MLPEINNPKWRQLIIGEINHDFKSVSAGLMISRLSRKVINDKSTSAINNYIRELYSFFKKYENVFADDINEIFYQE